MAKSSESELVTVRVPIGLLDALRLACQATGRSMSSEIRQGIQMRVDELRNDPEVLQAVQARIDQMQSLYGSMASEIEVLGASDEVAEADQSG